MLAQRAVDVRSIQMAQVGDRWLIQLVTGGGSGASEILVKRLNRVVDVITVVDVTPH